MAKASVSKILGALAGGGGHGKGKFEENKHRRGPGGKFASKGLSKPAPKAKTAKATVYGLADDMAGSSKKQVIDAAVKEGVNPSTAANHYFYWQKAKAQAAVAKKLGPNPVSTLSKSSDPVGDLKKAVGTGLGLKAPPKAPRHVDKKPEPKPDADKGDFVDKSDEKDAKVAGIEKLIAKHKANAAKPDASPADKKKSENNVKYYENALKKAKAAQPSQQSQQSPAKPKEAPEQKPKQVNPAAKTEAQKMEAYVAKLPASQQAAFKKSVDKYVKAKLYPGTDEIHVKHFEKLGKEFKAKHGIKDEDAPDFGLTPEKLAKAQADYKAVQTKAVADAKALSDKQLADEVAKEQALLKALSPGQKEQHEAWKKVQGYHNMGYASSDSLIPIRDKSGVKYNYTSAAVKSYTGSGYSSINGGLRAGKPPSSHAQALDKLIADSTFKEETIMYRGVGQGGTVFNGAPPPAEVSDKGFSSVSFNPGVARNFSDGKTLFRVKIPKGFPGLNIAMGTPSNPNHGLAGEAEVLLPRGTTFRVVARHKGLGPQISSHSPGKGNMDLVDLEPVLPPGYPKYN